MGNCEQKKDAARYCSRKMPHWPKSAASKEITKGSLKIGFQLCNSSSKLSLIKIRSFKKSENAIGSCDSLPSADSKQKKCSSLVLQKTAASKEIAREWNSLTIWYWELVSALENYALAKKRLHQKKSLKCLENWISNFNVLFFRQINVAEQRQ